MNDFTYIMVVIAGIIAGIGTAFIAWSLATNNYLNDEDDTQEEDYYDY